MTQILNPKKKTRTTYYEYYVLVDSVAVVLLDAAMNEEQSTFVTKISVENDVGAEVVGEVAVCEVAVCEGAVEGKMISDSAGQNSPDVMKYKRCVVCQNECKKRIKRCKSCKGGLYCSRKCREAHADEHQQLCEHIAELGRIEAAKKFLPVFSVREVNQVRLKLKNGLVKLVGEKPMLSCKLNKKECEALCWDTGAMVSLVDSRWLAETDPECEILTIEQFLEGDNLHLSAANNTNVDIEGVAMLTFGLGPLQAPVPFLVTKNCLDNPIIGYNVIKHLVNLELAELPKLLKNSMPSLTISKAEAVVSLISKDLSDEDEVVVGKETKVPANSQCRVKCRTKFEVSEPKQNVTCTPYPLDREFETSDSVVEMKLGKRSVHVVVRNPTNRTITLERGLVLGSIESVSAIVPIGPVEEAAQSIRPTPGKSDGPTAEVNSVQSEVVTPKFDLSHLSDEQRVIAEKVLEEEKDVFCMGAEDHGDVPD